MPVTGGGSAPVVVALFSVDPLGVVVFSGAPVDVTGGGSAPVDVALFSVDPLGVAVLLLCSGKDGGFSVLLLCADDVWKTKGSNRRVADPNTSEMTTASNKRVTIFLISFILCISVY
jgi:hypothetical protein